MGNFKGWAFAAASMFALSGLSHAEVVSFDLTDPTSSEGRNGSYADSYTYSVDGVEMTVTGWSSGGDYYNWGFNSNTLYRSDVGLFSGGLGAESRGLSHTVDNAAGDYDFLMFSFDQDVTLSGIELGYISNGRYIHDSDISYASMSGGEFGWTGSIFDATLGENVANPASISSDTWLIGAFHPFFSEAQDWSWDGFKISGLSVNVNAVPLPAAFWFFASGMGLVAYLRRRRAAAMTA